MCFIQKLYGGLVAIKEILEKKEFFQVMWNRLQYCKGEGEVRIRGLNGGGGAWGGKVEVREQANTNLLKAIWKPATIEAA